MIVDKWLKKVKVRAVVSDAIDIFPDVLFSSVLSTVVIAWLV